MERFLSSSTLPDRAETQSGGHHRTSSGLWRSLPCLGKKGVQPYGHGWTVLLALQANEKSSAFLITSTGRARDALASLTVPNQQFPWKMMITSASLGKLGSAGRWEEKKSSADAAALEVQLGTAQLAHRCCSLAQFRATLRQKTEQEKAFNFAFLSTSITLIHLHQVELLVDVFLPVKMLTY